MKRIKKLLTSSLHDLSYLLLLSPYPIVLDAVKFTVGQKLVQVFVEDTQKYPSEEL
jgi:hypothetical protein